MTKRKNNKTEAPETKPLHWLQALKDMSKRSKEQKELRERTERESDLTEGDR
ncbi:MAG: hypothetical protein KME43_11285 [Myxacorys chilensis ATA2-1-KO14]|jgi:hypothetical protein|nr:hypothetical protein [Myxacorys chilensis ATA2-1-KO14]